MRNLLLSVISFLLIFTLLLCSCDKPLQNPEADHTSGTVTSGAVSSNMAVSDTVTSEYLPSGTVTSDNSVTDDTSTESIGSAESVIFNPEVSSTETDVPSSAPEPPAPQPPAEVTFFNPISSEQAADPWIQYIDGYYYGLYTLADRITLCRSKSLETVFKDEKKTVLYANGTVKGNIWAPELHYIPSTGKWYIYASGSTDGWEFSTIRMFCLESVTDDPFGDYVFKGFTDSDTLAIDQTVFYDNNSGTLYTAFSEFTSAGQVITLAVMDNPWTVSKNRIRLSYPLYDWEKQGKTQNKDERVNEGPVFLFHNGKLTLLYSASGCWSQYYCLGMIEFVGNDFSVGSIMTLSNWKKGSAPVFSASNGVYGVGHCSFFNSPDESETWIAYHGMATPDAGEAGRYTYVQKIAFDENGLPVLGEPLSRDTEIKVPKEKPTE